MARASPLPAASPISGMPASKVTKMAEIRSRARHPATPAAPMAAATAKESRPSGSTKASSFTTRDTLAHRHGQNAAARDMYFYLGVHQVDGVPDCGSGQPGASGREARAAMPWSVTSEPLEWDLSAPDVLRLLRADAHPAALIGTWAGGSDIVVAEPTDVRSDPDSALAALDEGWPAQASADPDPAGFGGGWIGYLGFGLGGRILPVPPAPGAARRLPLAWLGYYDHALRRDRASGRWFFEALRTPGRAASRASRPRPPVAAVRAGLRLRPVPADSRSSRSPLRGAPRRRLHPGGRHLPGQHLPAAGGGVRRRPARRVLRRGDPPRPAVRRVPAAVGGQRGRQPVTGAVPA